MRHLATQPLLELLRPPAGFRTDRALLSAYSADPTVIVAILLALAGRDDDDARGSKVALARALDDLRGRASFVVQRGRLATPQRAPRVLGLLDRFVHEVPWNDGAGEGGGSWHAKVALVRAVAEENAGWPARWRLWLGSRNFTRDTSWDIAFSLETVPPASTRGEPLEGVDEMAARMAAKADQADVWCPLLAELAEARWEAPPGVTPRRVALMLPGDVARGFPKAPAGVGRVVAVAPFLDQGALRRLATWPGRRVLVSNEPELARLHAMGKAALAGFDLLALPFAPEDGTAPPEEGNAAAEAALESRGLHAKLVWAEHAERATLWLGSPNLTERAWHRNAEAYAEVDVGSGGDEAAQALREGIEAFLDEARPMEATDLGEAETDTDEDDLEDARTQVAVRLSGRQLRAEGCSVVETPAGPPHPDDARTTLEVGRLGGVIVVWPRGAARVEVPLADAVESELLSVRLSLGERHVTWTQCVPFDPPLPVERDAAALRDYLGARGILWWIRDVLDDVAEGDGGGPWDEEGQPRAPAGGGVDAAGLPTVEQALRAWTRTPERLEAVERIMRGAGTDFRADDDAEARRHLDAFARSWGVLRRGLREGKARGR